MRNVLAFALLTAVMAGAAGPVRVIVSSKAGDRLTEKASVPFSQPQPGLPAIAIDESTRYQKIDGFGASFAEAGLLVLNKLDKAQQEKVLEALFDPQKGAGFTLMKSPLAAFDFASAGPWYSYNDTAGDVQMQEFSIKRDLGPNGLVTFIKRSRKHGRFALQSTMDYPPDWMLDSKMNVKPEYYPALARYFVRYLQEYEKQGVHVDYLAPFNEPEHIYCRITFDQIRELIKHHLAPEMRRAGVTTKLQVSDANSRKVGVKDFPRVLDDPEVRKLIATMPVHGYSWEKETSDILTALHEKYPEIPIWQSEVCYARTIDKKPMPVLGFEDGDRWGRMIVADMNNWVSGWIYWNMILDHKGGPWLVSLEHRDPDRNDQHPVVIVNTDTKDVHYPGLYWYLAHFSKYVRPGAARVKSAGSIPGLSFVAFVNTDGARVLEVVNSAEVDSEFEIQAAGKAARVTAPAHGIATYIWK
jgi:glucosylceramidase